MNTRKKKELLKSRVYDKTNGKCAKCGKTIGMKNTISAYYIPKSKDGTNNYANLIPLCKRCARLKKSRILDIEKCLRYLPDNYKEFLKPNTVYSLNSYDFIHLVKDYFGLNDEKVYEMIFSQLAYCNNLLNSKGINYQDLKKALIPTKSSNDREIAFWFDSNKISSGMYGYEVFSRLIPLLDKKSTFSGLMGDYIDILKKDKSQSFLKQMLIQNINECNKSDWLGSSQYYVIYVSNITKNRLVDIVNELKKYEYFYGYTDLYSGSVLKDYLSAILVNGFIKSKNRIIMPNPDEEISNLNIYGYPFEENDYSVYSINADCFNMFLSYKIETKYVDKNDLSFSLNAIYPKFENVNSLAVEIPIDKWNYISRDAMAGKKGKGGIISSLDEELRNRSSFTQCVNQNLYRNYFYNLRRNKYGILLFNTCIPLKMVDGSYRKTLIALKFFPKQNRLVLETIT